MSETSLSLLDNIRLHQDEAAWKRVYDIYTPLIRNCLLKHGMNGPDAEDVVQEVMAVVLRRVGEFERQRTGSFRTWLRTITVNCLRDFNKRRRKLVVKGGSSFQLFVQQLGDSTSELSRMWEREHDEHVLDKLLEQIKHEFNEKTWSMFKLSAIDGVSPADVAEQLGVSRNAVFIAKSRVLSRLREIGDGLLDD